AQRHGRARPNQKVQPGGCILRLSESNRFSREIETNDASCRADKFRRTVACPAARIEHRLTVGVWPRERIAREVFAPQIVVYLSGNDTLAGELNRHLAPRVPAQRWLSRD